MMVQDSTAGPHTASRAHGRPFGRSFRSIGAGNARTNTNTKFESSVPTCQVYPLFRDMPMPCNNADPRTVSVCDTWQLSEATRHATLTAGAADGRAAETSVGAALPSGTLPDDVRM